MEEKWVKKNEKEKEVKRGKKMDWKRSYIDQRGEGGTEKKKGVWKEKEKSL